MELYKKPEKISKKVKKEAFLEKRGFTKSKK